SPPRRSSALRGHPPAGPRSPDETGRGASAWTRRGRDSSDEQGSFHVERVVPPPPIGSRMQTAWRLSVGVPFRCSYLGQLDDHALARERRPIPVPADKGPRVGFETLTRDVRM